MLAAIAGGDSPKAAASRARVRLRQQAAGCRSSLETVCALTPASFANPAWDSACWQRSSRSLWPSTKAVQRMRGRTWSYVIRVKDTETGNSKPRWVGGYATEEEAKAARDEAEGKARRGEYIDRNRITVTA
jgi:hypothetical protein